MYLFETTKVRNFFDRLYKQGRNVNELYNRKCSKEIFIRRACHKYLGKKYWVYNGYVRKPICITGFGFNYGYSDALVVYCIDYTNLSEVFREELSYNDLYSLEGIAVEGGFGEIEDMFKINEEDKTFVFNGNYLLKDSQRKHRKGTLEIEANTIEIAFGKLDNYIKENKDNPDRLIFTNYGDYTIKNKLK